jgi:hypothetical protein
MRQETHSTITLYRRNDDGEFVPYGERMNISTLHHGSWLLVSSPGSVHLTSLDDPEDMPAMHAAVLAALHDTKDEVSHELIHHGFFGFTSANDVPAHVTAAWQAYCSVASAYCISRWGPSLNTIVKKAFAPLVKRARELLASGDMPPLRVSIARITGEDIRRQFRKLRVTEEDNETEPVQESG